MAIASSSSLSRSPQIKFYCAIFEKYPPLDPALDSVLAIGCYPWAPPAMAPIGCSWLPLGLGLWIGPAWAEKLKLRES